MKNIFLKFSSVTFVSLLSLSTFANDIVSGKIVYVQSSADHDAVYFKLNNMPSGVTYFFVGSTKTTNAGCEMSGSMSILDKEVKTILSAKEQSATVKISYCKNYNGYGVVTTPNGYIGVY